MKLIEVHWTAHPEKSKGLYFDSEGKARSPWYDEQIKKKKMTPSAVAKELDLSDEMSVEGIVFSEFKDSHIARGEFTLNPHLPVIRTIDYGACCAALFSQKNPYGGIFVFHEIVIPVEGSAPRLAKAINSYSANLVCNGFNDYDDPAGKHDGWVNGTTSSQTMQANGINPTHKVSGASSQRRTDRIEMIHGKLMERVGNGDEMVQIHESCTNLIDSFQSGYRHPENTDGTINLDDIEEIHPYEDVMDCFGMTLMEEFTVQKLEIPKRQVRRGNKYTGR